jgi:HK97 family phage portal protein
MNIFSKIASGWRAIKAVGTTLAQLPRTTWYGGGLGRAMRAAYIGVDQDPLGGLIGWAYFAVDKVAQYTAGILPELYRLNGDEIERVEDHPLLALLYKPNPTMTGSDFRYLLGGMLRIFGRAPIALIRPRPGARPTQLWPLRPDLLTAEIAKNGTLTKWIYRVGSDVTEFAPGDVLNVRRPNFANHMMGSSPLAAAALEIDADIQMALWNRFVIENGAEPGGVLETEQELSDKSFDRLREAWEARHGGPQNAGKVAILEKGLKFNKTTQSQKELDFNTARGVTGDRVLTLMGIPTSLIKDTANRANAETAERVLLMQTVIPTARVIYDQLSEFLVPEYDTAMWLDFENPVSDDAESRRADNVAAVNTWMTVNEVRERENLPPLEGGDFLYMNMIFLPTIGEGATSATSEVVDAQSGTATEDAPKDHTVIRTKAGPVLAIKRDRSKRVLSAKERRIKGLILARSWKQRALKSLPDMIAEGVMRNVKGVTVGGKRQVRARIVKSSEDAPKEDEDPNGGLPEHLAVERKAYIHKLPRRLIRMRRTMHKFFGDLEEEVMRNLQAEGLPKDLMPMMEKKAWEEKAKSWIDRVIYDPKKQISVLVRLTKPVYKTNIEDGAKDIAELMGVDYEDIGASQPVIDYLKEKPVKFAGEVNETTINALRDQLKSGLAAGESLGEIGDRVAHVFDMARGYRTEAIARTEVGSALNFGRSEEMSVQGVKKRMWVSIFSNTRDDHAEAHGQVVGADEDFEVGGEKLRYPQDPSGSPANVVNCQCSVSPVYG